MQDVDSGQIKKGPNGNQVIELDALTKAQLHAYKFLEHQTSPLKKQDQKSQRGYAFAGGEYRKQLEKKCKNDLKFARRADSPVKNSLRD
jgi:hypothetical protein